MLCLQGTNSGAHLSWAEARMPPDPVKIASGLDFAHQAVARGYAAVCIEQRCFGLRREQELDRASADPCVDAFHHALLFGRTLLGDRVGDVLRVIDWLANGGAGLDLDLARLHALGHSAGGTDRKSTRLNSSHKPISYAVFCLKKKKTEEFFSERHGTESRTTNQPS